MSKTTELVNETELNAAEQEAESSSSVYTAKLAEPVEYEDKTYTEITFDFGALTGEDALAIESELDLLGKPLIAPEFSGEYLIRMASRASNPRVGTDFLKQLPIGVFNKIRNKGRSFLLKSGL